MPLSRPVEFSYRLLEARALPSDTGVSSLTLLLALHLCIAATGIRFSSVSNSISRWFTNNRTATLRTLASYTGFCFAFHRTVKRRTYVRTNLQPVRLSFVLLVPYRLSGNTTLHRSNVRRRGTDDISTLGTWLIKSLMLPLSPLSLEPLLP